MRIIRAEHLGMCFGVRDAIQLAEKTAAIKPLTVLGELVHNRGVIDRLDRLGVRFTKNLAEVDTPSVMITAHGTSEKNRRHVREQGFEIQEATCPLVHFAHRSLRELVEQGCHPVIVGQAGHVEVRGMTDDLTNYDVILSARDVASVPERSRYGVVAQTTQPIEHVHHLARLLQDRFPMSEVHFRDTVCQPTKQRQSAAIQLARDSDVVIVIGGANSNNTKKLLETCSRFCDRVHHIQNADELIPRWFLPDDTVGMTAGTSTPDDQIAAVAIRLHEIEEALNSRQTQPERIIEPAMV